MTMLHNGMKQCVRILWRAEKLRTCSAMRLLKIRKQLKYWPRRRSIALSHVSYYAVGNAGDTALSECIRRTFNRELRTPVNWHLEDARKPVDSSLLNRINKSKAVLVGGGGMFLPDTNRNLISGWTWACGKESLNQIRVPIVLYSIGYNYFRGQKPSELFIDNLNAIVEKSAFVGLRNRGSIVAVQSLLRESLRDKVCYQPCTTTLIRKIMPELPPKRETGKIAFNFAFDRSKLRFGEDKEEILREVIQSMYVLRKKGYTVYLVAHRMDDLSILSKMRDWRGIHPVNASVWDLDRLARFYNEMDVVVGMRGHAQMIPFGVNCHIISLGSHEKLRWFMEDINMMDSYVELTRDVSNLSEQIVDKFEKIHERNGEETTRRIVKAQDKLLEITQDNMRTIRQIIADTEE